MTYEETIGHANEATADVGVAMVTGTDVTMSRAQAALVKGNMTLMPPVHGPSDLK